MADARTFEATLPDGKVVRFRWHGDSNPTEDDIKDVLKYQQKTPQPVAKPVIPINKDTYAPDSIMGKIGSYINNSPVLSGALQKTQDALRNNEDLNIGAKLLSLGNNIYKGATGENMSGMEDYQNIAPQMTQKAFAPTETPRLQGVSGALKDALGVAAYGGVGPVGEAIMGGAKILPIAARGIAGVAGGYGAGKAADAVLPEGMYPDLRDALVTGAQIAGGLTGDKFAAKRFPQPVRQPVSTKNLVLKDNAQSNTQGPDPGPNVSSPQSKVSVPLELPAGPQAEPQTNTTANNSASDALARVIKTSQVNPKVAPPQQLQTVPQAEIQTTPNQASPNAASPSVQDTTQPQIPGAVVNQPKLEASQTSVIPQVKPPVSPALQTDSSPDTQPLNPEIIDPGKRPGPVKPLFINPEPYKLGGPKTALSLFKQKLSDYDKRTAGMTPAQLIDDLKGASQGQSPAIDIPKSVAAPAVQPPAGAPETNVQLPERNVQSVPPPNPALLQPAAGAPQKMSPAVNEPQAGNVYSDPNGGTFHIIGPTDDPNYYNVQTSSGPTEMGLFNINKSQKLLDQPTFNSAQLGNLYSLNQEHPEWNNSLKDRLDTYRKEPTPDKALEILSGYPTQKIQEALKVKTGKRIPGRVGPPPGYRTVPIPSVASKMAAAMKPEPEVEMKPKVEEPKRSQDEQLEVPETKLNDRIANYGKFWDAVEPYESKGGTSEVIQATAEAAKLTGAQATEIAEDLRMLDWKPEDIDKVISLSHPDAVNDMVPDPKELRDYRRRGAVGPIKPPNQIPRYKASFDAPTGVIGEKLHRLKHFITSEDHFLSDNPLTKPIVDQGKINYYKMQQYIYDTSRYADQVMKDLPEGKSKMVELFDHMNGKYSSDPKIVNVGKGLRALFDKMHNDMLNAGVINSQGRAPNYLNDYLSKMYEDPSLSSALKDNLGKLFNGSPTSLKEQLFGKSKVNEDVSGKQSGLYDRGSTPRTPFAERRQSPGTNNLQIQDVNKILRTYTDSVARAIHMQPFAKFADQKLRSVPDSLFDKQAAKVWVKRLTGLDRQDESPAMHLFRNVDNFLSRQASRSTLAFSTKVQIYHGMRFITQGLPEVKQYAADGIAEYMKNPAEAHRDVVRAGLVPSGIHASRFMTGVEKFDRTLAMADQGNTIVKAILLKSNMAKLKAEGFKGDIRHQAIVDTARQEGIINDTSRIPAMELPLKFITQWNYWLAKYGENVARNLTESYVNNNKRDLMKFLSMVTVGASMAYLAKKTGAPLSHIGNKKFFGTSAHDWATVQTTEAANIINAIKDNDYQKAGAHLLRFIIPTGERTIKIDSYGDAKVDFNPLFDLTEHEDQLN